jgi:hypothetical protein
MKIHEFMYHKSDGLTKSYNVIPLKEDSTYIEGISIGDLNEEDATKVKKIFLEFESKLNPYMKNYRKFTKNKFVVNSEKIVLYENSKVSEDNSIIITKG